MASQSWGKADQTGRLLVACLKPLDLGGELDLAVLPVPHGGSAAQPAWPPHTRYQGLWGGMGGLRTRRCEMTWMEVRPFAPPQRVMLKGRWLGSCSLTVGGLGSGPYLPPSSAPAHCSIGSSVFKVGVGHLSWDSGKTPRAVMRDLPMLGLAYLKAPVYLLPSISAFLSLLAEWCSLWALFILCSFLTGALECTVPPEL